jgi:hypothetical protein
MHSIATNYEKKPFFSLDKLRIPTTASNINEQFAGFDFQVLIAISRTLIFDTKSKSYCELLQLIHSNFTLKPASFTADICNRGGVNELFTCKPENFQAKLTASKEAEESEHEI